MLISMPKHSPAIFSATTNMPIELRAIFVALVLAGFLPWGSVGASSSSETEPARRFGYGIGDIIRQTLHVRHPPQQQLIETSLPKEGRLGPWFVLRRVVAIAEAEGSRIELTYQAINAPTEVSTVALPALHLRLRDGPREVDEPIAITSLSLGPLTAATGNLGDGASDLRPDTLPPLVDVTAQIRRLQYYAALATLLGIGWTSWHLGLGLRGRAKRPFARAEREISRLLGKTSSGEALRAGMRTLHQAFNATAGAVLFAETVEDFIAANPVLTPARAGIADFFAASRQAFFGNGASAVAFDGARLLSLARRLKELERSAP
jgi:mxaA protein